MQSPWHVLRPLSAALLALPALTQVPQAQEASDDPLLYVYSGGLDALLVDPRDEGLLRALRMLDDRLLEVPGEVGADFPPSIIRLLFDVGFSPMDFELHLDSMEESGGEVPVDAQLRIFGNAEKRESIARGTEAILTMGGMASHSVEGADYQQIPLPVGALLHGAIDDSVGREGYFLVFGEPSTAPPRTAQHGLPDGVEPALFLEADARAIRPYLEMAVDMAGPQGDILYEMLDMFGLFGEEHLGYRAAIGHGTDRAHTVVRTINGVPALESLGSLVREPLTMAEMRLIPEDAVFASMWKSDLSFMSDMFQVFSDAVEEDLLIEIEKMSGIHLGHDVFDVIGHVGGVYMADSTGGGGLVSTVIFNSVKDEAKMNATLDKVAHKIDALGSLHAKGYVAMRTWEHQGTRCRSLQFPGVPVPIEPSFCIKNGMLWVGATPQALLGALEHASNAKSGLIDSARFQDAAFGSMEDLTSFSYQDTSRLVHDGYGWGTLMFTALQNAVRSPHDPERDPGLVMPTYSGIAQGARPSVMFGRIEGNDIVVRGQSDRSMVANFTAVLGNPLLLVGVCLGLVGGIAEEPAVQQLFR